MNRKHIFTVEDAFYIEGRGVVLVGNCLVTKALLFPNQKLELVLPSGDLAVTEIIGVDYFTKCFSDNQAMGVLVALQHKEQAPLGTKVYAE